MNKGRLWAIIRKEFIQIKRDRPSLAIAFIMPVFMILLFGYAVNTDVNNMFMAVLDYDRSQAGRLLAEQFVATGYFTITAHPDNYREVRTLLDSGKAKAALVIPEGYETTLKRGEKAAVQFLVNGSDPLFAHTAFQTAGILGEVQSQSLLTQAAARAGRPLPQGPAVDVEVRAWHNPGLESLKFNVPGLIGLIMQNITVMLTAFALVRERERGTLEQLMVTPIRSPELMVGKLVPYVLIAFVDVGISLAIGTLWFHVPIRGSIVLLLSLSLLFLLFALGVGMLISTVTKTQLQAMQSTILVILPAQHPAQRLRLPARFHAAVSPVPGRSHSPDLLSGDPAGYNAKGHGADRTLAGRGRPDCLRTGVIVLASLKFRKRVE